MPDEHDGTPQDKTGDIVSPVEMDTMVTEEVPGWQNSRPLTLNEAGTSELRKRNTSNHALEEESVWTAKVRTFVAPLIFEIDRVVAALGL